MKRGRSIGWKVSAALVVIVAGTLLGAFALDHFLTIRSESYHRTYTFGLVSGAVAVSTLTMSFLIQRLLRRPIRSLIEGTQRLGEGEHDFRFSGVRSDEFGELERAFNRMAERITADAEELSEARDYLEGVIENSADIIITVNLDHEIQRFNRGAERALGHDRSEVIGRRMRTLFVRPEDRDEALRILEHEDNVLNFETRFKTKRGEARDVLLTLSRLHDREGRLIGTFGISKDITKEKELLRQLIQSKKLIGVGQAITGISHATKNIISALEGGAYLVRSGLKSGDRNRLDSGWKMVEDGISRIGALSKNLLQYARGWKSEVERCDLNEMVAEVTDSLVEKARGAGVTISSIPAEGLQPILCDPRLVRTTIMDIATNAIDACVEKDYVDGEVPQVLLRVSPPDHAHRVVIEIIDNGCGMDELTIQRVFEPFFSTKEEWGTGVGLDMASRIIEEHGGRCEVESRVDEGSTFRIVLPGGDPDQGKE